jgi:predicted amidohydrolase YtcJ
MAGNSILRQPGLVDNHLHAGRMCLNEGVYRAPWNRVRSSKPLDHTGNTLYDEDVAGHCSYLFLPRGKGID